MLFWEHFKLLVAGVVFLFYFCNLHSSKNLLFHIVLKLDSMEEYLEGPKFKL